MSSNQADCDQATIDQFLDDQLDAEEQQAFEGHLESCVTCREGLNAKAAGPGLWDEVRKTLGSGESLLCDEIDASSPASSAVYECEGDNHNEDALTFLKPTDDPRMLGRFGGYEIVGVVGRGGMGTVLKGFDASLNRYVAIKVLSPHLAASGAARKRFAREAQAAAAVVHDNVIAIHSVSEDNELPYLVMPYERGVSLQKRLDEAGSLDLVEILRIAAQTASGLAAAHAQGLVHRDIKSGNILLAEGVERVKLTDFGLARAADDASLTRTGVIAGTPQFMSPEQARGERVDHRSDLFSLGSVLYAMCTGRPPFRAETSYGVLRRITDSQPRPIRELNPEIPTWLCHVIEKLHEKSPGDRSESAAEVADLLNQCLAHVQEPTAVPLPESLVEMSRDEDVSPSLARRRPWAGGLAAGVLALMAIVGLALWSGPPKDEAQEEGDANEMPAELQKENGTLRKALRSAQSDRDRAFGKMVELTDSLHGMAGKVQRLQNQQRAEMSEKATETEFRVPAHPPITKVAVIGSLDLDQDGVDDVRELMQPKNKWGVQVLAHVTPDGQRIGGPLPEAELFYLVAADVATEDATDATSDDQLTPFARESKKMREEAREKVGEGRVVSPDQFQTYVATILRERRGRDCEDARCRCLIHQIGESQIERERFLALVAGVELEIIELSKPVEIPKDPDEETVMQLAKQKGLDEAKVRQLQYRIASIGNHVRSIDAVTKFLRRRLADFPSPPANVNRPTIRLATNPNVTTSKPGGNKSHLQALEAKHKELVRERDRLFGIVIFLECEVVALEVPLLIPNGVNTLADPKKEELEWQAAKADLEMLREEKLRNQKKVEALRKRLSSLQAELRGVEHQIELLERRMNVLNAGSAKVDEPQDKKIAVTVIKDAQLAVPRIIDDEPSPPILAGDMVVDPVYPRD